MKWERGENLGKGPIEGGKKKKGVRVKNNVRPFKKKNALCNRRGRGGTEAGGGVRLEKRTLVYSPGRGRKKNITRQKKRRLKTLEGKKRLGGKPKERWGKENGLIPGEGER